jgi:hypothetical protein
LLLNAKMNNSYNLYKTKGESYQKRCHGTLNEYVCSSLYENQQSMRK